MADIKREQERDELHRAIWNIADELRGSVDGWDFKSYARQRGRGDSGRDDKLEGLFYAALRAVL